MDSVWIVYEQCMETPHTKKGCSTLKIKQNNIYFKIIQCQKPETSNLKLET